MVDSMTFKTGTLERARVVGFRGHEGISCLYAFTIYLTIGPDEADAFDASWATDTATLTIERGAAPPFLFHGVLSEVAVLDHDAEGRALVSVVLVPRLSGLTRTRRSRVFTKASLPDILQQVFVGMDMSPDDYELRLSETYPIEEHVCQYGESDFAFVSRWMEREGLYYFFEHGPDREKLIITDHGAAHVSLMSAPVRFSALFGADATAGPCLRTFVSRSCALPGGVRFRDASYEKPALDVSGSASVAGAGRGQIDTYGARVFSPDAAGRLARLRAEELSARRLVFHGTGTVGYLRSGYTFDLEGHPRSDARYLAIEVEHHGVQADVSTPELRALTDLADLGGDVYRVEVRAIPARVLYRAASLTPWPRIYGTEPAVIDGEAESDYAQLDDQGRYLVRFGFDEAPSAEGKASTRLRMMQPHGGAPEGWHFPLRKGTEVLVTFLGGDPDRPVIAGVVHTLHTPSPVSSANHTRNVIQTGGTNRIELEDKQGGERITISCPHANSIFRLGAPNAEHTCQVKTDGGMLHDAGGDLDVAVGADHTLNVDGTTTETHAGDHSTASNADRTITVGGALSLTVNGDAVHTFGANKTTNVAGLHTETVGGGWMHTVSGPVVESYGPVLANYKSLVWVIPGGAVTVTPSWELVVPSRTETNVTKRELTGFASEATGIHGEFEGLHIEVCASHFETVGLHVGRVGIHDDTDGISAHTAAVRIRSAAAHFLQ
jgi:type VI secretion system secreted protein VgrG